MIGVVGAGIGGLALSHHLERVGVEHIVFEASSVPGGVIRTSTVDGRILDHGPQRTRVTPGVEALVRASGLEDETVALAPGLPLFVYRDGRLRRVPFSLRELSRTDLLTPIGKLRVLAEPATAAPRLDPPPGETVEEFLSRKFGREAYRHLLGPLFGGLYGSDPGEMYARHSLAPVLESFGIRRSMVMRALRSVRRRGAAPVSVSFRLGMGQLVEALHARQRRHVRLDTPVTAMRPAGVGWTLETAGESFSVEAVVLACAAPEAARLLEEAAPESARRLAALRYNDLALVHLFGQTSLSGIGYQVSLAESELRTRGVTWNASALGRDGIYTAFLGGSRDPGLVSLPDAEIAEIARTEFREVTGQRTDPVGVSRTRMPAWDRSWTAMDDLPLPPGLHLCASYESRPGIPGRVERAKRLAETLARTPKDHPANLPEDDVLVG